MPVIAVGQDAFPAFWSRSSGLAAPLRLDDPKDIARAADLLSLRRTTLVEKMRKLGIDRYKAAANDSQDS